MKRPRIGLLGLMIEGYEPIFPGIIENQTLYTKKLAEQLDEYAEITFDALATNREEIEKTVKRYNALELDGLLIVMLAYSHSGWIINAMQNNRLPLAIAVLQPDEEMLPSFTEYNFTVNQGIHGAQDNANMLHRLGIPFQTFAGSRNSERFSEFFKSFSMAAKAFTALKKMKVAVIGKMNNMGDVFTDDIGLQKKIGCEYSYEYIGTIYNIMKSVADEAVSERIEFERSLFEIDSSMPEEVHAEAVRQYLALKEFMEKGGYSALTLHFETLGTDGRFNRLPFLAASNLLADGYGYAAEGDSMCATLMKLALLASNGRATFSEMYAMDFKSSSILMCHAGEGNWRVARKDKKPVLLNKVFNEGGLENPPTPLFTPEPGEATILSFADVGNGKYRFVVAAGEILDKCDLNGCEMPYLFFKPRAGFERCAEEWLRLGGTHHEAVTLGDTRGFWKMLAVMLDVEYCEIA